MGTGRSTAPDTFVTARLEAERLAPAHFDLLDAMHSHERVMATLGGVRTRETTWRYIEDNLRHWAEHGFGLWIFRDREDGAFVGRGGVRRVGVGAGPETEAAYALMPEHWGRGLATEIAVAAADIGFQDLLLPDLVAFTPTTNHASRRVMEKTAFTYERNVKHAGLPHVLYRRWATEGPGA